MGATGYMKNGWMKVMFPNRPMRVKFQGGPALMRIGSTGGPNQPWGTALRLAKGAMKDVSR